MIFNSFPRECGPPRKIVNNKEEWLSFVNSHNGRKSAVYTSIYKFNDISDYNSAVVNKLFFDFDDKSCDGYKECKVLHRELLRKDIKHFIVMSGRGYHLYILTRPLVPNNPKSCIYNSQHYYIDKLNIIVDTQVVGNPAQLARVPNTYNQRGKRYCIPLTQEQFNMGDSKIKHLAINQNFVKDIIIGNNFLDINKFDFVSEKFDDDIVYSNNNLGESSGNANNYHDCIKDILAKKNLGWRERYLVILYFRDTGYSMNETHQILKEHLTPAKLRHCIVDEKQLQYLYTRHDLFFPEKEYGIKIYK